MYKAACASCNVINIIDRNHRDHSVYYDASVAFGDNLSDQKYKEYKAYAISLLRSSTIDKNYLQTVGKIDDKIKLMALFDELIHEHNENIVEQVKNEFRLNFPQGMNIAAGDMSELIDKIWNNRAAIHYLEHLYDDSISFIRKPKIC